MNIIPFPSTADEPISIRCTVRELCRDYIRKRLSAQSLAESKTALRLMKTYLLPVLGELDQSEVDMDALRRLHAYAAYRSPLEAKAVLDLMVEVFWDWTNERLRNESESL
jgi:hypothetical protein